MASIWEDTFRNRMEKFSSAYSADIDDVAISIKVRVESGCFHREHSPHAYEIIDDHLRSVSLEKNNFAIEEHESGPEILVLVSALVALSASIIDLVVTIIKARAESVKKGDSPRAPVELIVRRVEKSGSVLEEKNLRIGYDDPIDSKDIERKLNATTKKLLSNANKKLDSKKKKRSKS